MRIRNFTGHPLQLNQAVYTSYGQARVSSKMHCVGIADNIPILQVTERSVRGLPDPQDDMLIVVSGIVAAAAQRPDVLCPGRVERDEHGEVMCAKALIRLAGI